MGMGMGMGMGKMTTPMVRPSPCMLRAHANVEAKNIGSSVSVLFTDLCYHIANFLEMLNDQ